MNCSYCNAPLIAQARFCSHCGAPVAQNSQKVDLPTQPVPRENSEHSERVEQQTPGEQVANVKDAPVIPTTYGAMSSEQQSTPLLYYTLNTQAKGKQMFPAVVHTNAYQERPTRRKRSAGGCALGCLTTLVLLLIVLGVGWVFVGRPYFHAMAESKIDNALNAGVNQIPSSPLISLIPAGTTIPINENAINNLIVLNISPSDPIQKPETQITTQNITLSFQLYNFPSSISMVPAVQNGHLVAQNVQVNGIMGFIMSPSEMTDILNKHFADAQNKLGKTVTSTQLKANEFDITLG